MTQEALGMVETEDLQQQSKQLTRCAKQLT